MRSAGIVSLPIKVILRSGSPSNILELKRVAFEHAKSIIVLAGWTRESDASGRDVEAIKTAMLLSGSLRSFFDLPSLLMVVGAMLPVVSSAPAYAAKGQ